MTAIFHCNIKVHRYKSCKKKHVLKRKERSQSNPFTKGRWEVFLKIQPADPNCSVANMSTVITKFAPLHDIKHVELLFGKSP